MANDDTNLTYISAADLSLRKPSDKLAIVDVRDEERSYNGHIAGSLHCASDTFDDEISDLLEKVKEQDTVVFHCAKSQVRGPTCAMKFANHLSKLAGNKEIEKIPKICVLEQGYDGWAATGHPVCSCSDPSCKK